MSFVLNCDHAALQEESLLVHQPILPTYPSHSTCEVFVFFVARLQGTYNHVIRDFIKK